MKTTVELNIEDVRQVLANYFNTDTKNVSIEMKTVDAGYGQDEHKEHTVKVVIDMTENQQR